MEDNRTDRWSCGLKYVVKAINTSVARCTGKTPHEVVYDQSARRFDCVPPIPTVPSNPAEDNDNDEDDNDNDYEDYYDHDDDCDFDDEIPQVEGIQSPQHDKIRSEAEVDYLKTQSK